jgi:3-keto-disaccharide hydrolase
VRLAVILVAATMLAPQQAPRYSVVQDGEAHGDPPFLLEEGWQPLLNGTDLSGWRACDPGAKNEWFTTRFVRYERILAPIQLSGRAGPSGVILNGPAGKTANLCTERSFGDIELYLEFMLAKGSNSGVYLQGLYEMQIFDSWASAEEMSTSDAGAIYHQWIENRGAGGSAPRVNAARRPGEWQSYQAWFRAPRFDAAGKKIEPARFLRVLLNGQTVQTEVVVEGPTRASLTFPEGTEHPLMLQGDHGPVAFRNIHVRPLRPLIVR